MSSTRLCDDLLVLLMLNHARRCECTVAHLVHTQWALTIKREQKAYPKVLTRSRLVAGSDFGHHLYMCLSLTSP